jgi:hypothetical protein
MSWVSPAAQAVLPSLQDDYGYLESQFVPPTPTDYADRIRRYNGIPTIGSGVPFLVTEINSTGLTANVGLATLYTPPVAGYYRISAYVILTTAASVSSTLPQVNIVWGDGTSGVAQSQILTGGIVAAPTTPGYGSSAVANTTAPYRGGSMVLHSSTAAIQYSTSGYTSNAAGMTYAVRIRVEALT